jgi:hypothetical protein
MFAILDFSSMDFERVKDVSFMGLLLKKSNKGKRKQNNNLKNYLFKVAKCNVDELQLMSNII